MKTLKMLSVPFPFIEIADTNISFNKFKSILNVSALWDSGFSLTFAW